MIKSQAILFLFFCVSVFGQQIDSFITQGIVENPGKTIERLAGDTPATPYDAAKNYYILGKCYAFLNQEEKALDYFILSKKEFEKLGEIAFAKQIALEAHITISSQENFDNYGNTFLEEYSSYADSIDSPIYKAYTYNEYAKNAFTYYFLERTEPKVLDSVYSIFQTALKYADKADDNTVKSILYSNIAVVLTTKKEFDSSRYYLNKSWSVSSVKDNYSRFTNYHNYGNAYLLEGDYNNALKYFFKAEKTKIPYYQDKALRRLYERMIIAYDSLDNDLERRKYQNLYDSIDRTIEDRLQNVKMHESYIKYDVENKERKISTLQKVVENFNKHKFIYGIALFLVFLLALYSFVRWKKVDARRKKLQSEHETVQAEHEETVKQLESVKQLVIEDHLVLKNKTKLYVNSLLYIKSEDHYLNFITTEGKHHFLRGKLKEVAEQLPPNFKKCHRSYIVNTNYIKNTSSKGITLINNELIPVSRNFKI